MNPGIRILPLPSANDFFGERLELRKTPRPYDGKLSLKASEHVERKQEKLYLKRLEILHQEGGGEVNTIVL